MRSLNVLSGLRIVAFALAFPLALAGRAAERQVLKGHAPAAVAGLAPLDRLAATQQLHLAISLPLRNQESLNDLLKQLYDPASPSFHHFLDPRQFTAAFGPAEKDYQALINFANSSGLTVTATHPNRRLLEVTAPVATIEKAFHVNMREYPHPTEPRTFYSPDVDPSLDLDIPVLSIAGLDNYLIPHPCVHAHPMAQRLTPTPDGGSELDSTYIGLDFRSAYVPGVSLTGAGQSVGLLEFDSYYPVDIADYLADPNSGLSNANVILTNAVLENMTGYPSSGNIEVALDIAMAISMAPGLSSVIVYEAPTDGAYADALLDHMADDNLCKQLSCSWTGFDDAGVEQAFLQMATQGQSFFISSGDTGAYVSANPVDPPVDNTNITAVGGTTLSTSGPQGSWVSETAWSWFVQSFDGLTGKASSGGISTSFALPVWQQGISMSGNMGSTKYRNVPDVAMVANEIFWYGNGGEELLGGGTSAAAPLWAGFAALVNQHGAAHGHSSVGFLNPALYAIGKGANYASDFHDVTTGNNTNSYTYTKFFAVSGYDLCTGWGTPNGSNMINALLPGLSPITPALAWSTPTPVVYGTALSASQLSATAIVPGSFAYNPTNGAVLNAGATVLSVVFTPNDTYDYNSVTTTVTQIVTPAPLSVTANNATQVYGQSSPAFTGTLAGLENGDAITASYNCSATASSPVGTYPILPGLRDPNDRLGNYSVTTTNGNLSVTAAPLSVTANNATRVYGQSNPTFTASYSGFVNGDTLSVLTGSPSLSTGATLASSVAASPYPILAAGGTLSANNYSFVFNDGQLTITPASTANAVSSSANPAPLVTNVTFTATLTAVSPGSGTPTGTVQFYADGAPLGSPIALVGGVAGISTSSLSSGTHAISDQYTGDGNFFGSTGSLIPNQSIASPPFAANVALERSQNSGAKISVAALLANDTDPFNEVLTLVSAGPASTNGGTVVVSENWVFYAPPSDTTNSDAFSYVIENSDGMQATGTVSVTVAVDPGQSQNIVGLENLGNNSSLIQFQGIPGRVYTIQYAESLGNPVWQTLGTSTADSTGAFTFTNAPASGSPPQYYRSTYP